MPEITVLQKLKVSPSPPLPSQPPLPLSYLDEFWLHSSNVERLFFYDFPHPISHFIENQIHPFITSLSLTLRYFYPLAGTIRRSPTSENQFDIVYTEGDSVSITIAAFTGEDFRNLSGHQPRDINKLRQLVPRESKSSSGEWTPLSVQVTLFSNQGLCIGFSVNHAVCDGAASMHFIRSWAAACCSADATFDIAAPLLDRSVIVDHRGMRQILLEKLGKLFEIYAELLYEEPTVKSTSPSLVSATFTLSRDKISLLKKQVQARAVKEVSPSFHISTFVVTCAYVWRCLARVRGYDDDRPGYFSCAVDWRSRMRPPIRSNYFGNCLGCSVAEVQKSGKIAGEDGIEVAAMAIGKCIDELQGMDVGELLEALIDRLGELVKFDVPLSVAGSPKLGVYATDFGWGRPVKVEVTSIVHTKAMSLAESREEEGGMEIGIVLTEEEMKEFAYNFSCSTVIG